MPIAHAQQGPLAVQAETLYSTMDVTGNILPHFQNTPSIGGKIQAEYPVGLATFRGGISTAMAPPWNKGQGEEMTTGHSSFFAAAERRIEAVTLSAQHMYMHTNGGNDGYEIVLKAQFDASEERKPYVFMGLITPAQIPIEEMMGLGGIGLSTYTKIYKGVDLKTDSFIATTLLKSGGIGKKVEETVLKTKIALATQPQSGTTVEIGLNVYQDIRREKYYTWWSASATHRF